MADYPTFGFGLEYAAELIYCEIKMQESSYLIYFNNNLIGGIELTDSLTWIQVSGRLMPQQLVDMIGEKIENHFQ